MGEKEKAKLFCPRKQVHDPDSKHHPDSRQPQNLKPLRMWPPLLGSLSQIPRAKYPFQDPEDTWG